MSQTFTPEWKKYEENVAKAFEKLGYRVHRNYKVESSSGVKYEIDVLVQDPLGLLKIGIQCKYYTEKKVSRDMVSEWLGVCEDLGLHPGYASYSGYTEDAEKLARSKNFLLIDGYVLKLPLNYIASIDLRKMLEQHENQHNRIERQEAEISKLTNRLEELVKDVNDISSKLENLEKEIEVFNEIKLLLEKSLTRRFRRELAWNCIHMDSDGYCTQWYWDTQIKKWDMKQDKNSKWLLNVEKHKWICALCPSYIPLRKFRINEVVKFS